jgi:hypothetical protein
MLMNLRISHSRVGSVSRTSRVTRNQPRHLLSTQKGIDGWISSGLEFRVCSLTSPHPVQHPHYWASWKIMKLFTPYLANKANVVIHLYLYLVWQKDWNLHGSTQSIYSWKKIMYSYPRDTLELVHRWFIIWFDLDKFLLISTSLLWCRRDWGEMRKGRSF